MDNQVQRLYLPTVMVLVTMTAVMSRVGTPEVIWMRTYGSIGFEHCYSMQKTPDGGFIMGGWTDSFGNGQQDMYLVKADAQGRIQWQRSYGGAADDYGQSVRPTPDGGYVLAGYTQSFGSGDYDMYLVKTDSTGNLLWSRTYGGSKCDMCYCVQPTRDGGFILGGDTRSFGKNCQMYLVKTDSEGRMVWQASFGEDEDDFCLSLAQTADGGFILGGDSNSFGINIFDADMILVKTDSLGRREWQRTYGGSLCDGCYCVGQLPDGGYILGGDTQSFGMGNYDMYLVRTDSLGNLLWQNTFGGEGLDDCHCVHLAEDGGFLLTGYSDSFKSGNTCLYLVKTDPDGNMLWQETLGGLRCDYGYSMQVAADKSLILAGYTESFAEGGDDVWLVCVRED